VLNAEPKLSIDYTEKTGPVYRVGVVVPADDITDPDTLEAAVVALAQEELGTDQWPTVSEVDGGFELVFEVAYL
jgi:hypothetical protein